MKKMLQWLLVSCIVLGGMPYLNAQEQETTTEEVEAQESSPDAASEAEETIEITQSESDTLPAEEDTSEDATVDATVDMGDEVTTQEEASEEEATDDAFADETGIEVADDQTTDQVTEDETDYQPENPYEEPDVESPKWEGAQEEVTEKEPPDLGPDEIMGIDTVDLEDPQGNWLYKRVWWERTEAKFEKIRELVNKILESRTNFFAKRAELDKNVLDPFYIKIGISQGELQESLAELIGQLSREIQEKKGESYLEKAEADKKSLETVQKEIQNVIKQDGEIEDAILMLVEQITNVRNIEQQAWQDFKNIARVLDDKKARELFYRVDTAWRNIKDLQSYIEQNFSNSFDNLIARTKDQIKRVEDSVGVLKERNIDLKNKTLGVLAKIEQEIDEDEDDEIEEVPRGILRRFIFDPVSSIVKGVWNIITWPFKKILGIFGIGQVAEVDDEDEEAEESESEGAGREVIVEETVATPEPIEGVVGMEESADASDTGDEGEISQEEIEVEAAE